MDGRESRRQSAIESFNSDCGLYLIRSGTLSGMVDSVTASPHSDDTLIVKLRKPTPEEERDAVTRTFSQGVIFQDFTLQYVMADTNPQPKLDYN